ncbi:MAG: Excinuclease ABC, C subunit-like [Pseudolabrys sp.]|nr:Excinuclease ABC, C subunit-like [Pseudolabrys sp.]
MKRPAVYIMTNKRNGTLYTGVTSDLLRRAHDHRTGATTGFTSRYGLKMLVWYELYDDMTNAITREKQLKAGSRRKKVAAIEAQNPQWRDLYPDLF